MKCADQSSLIRIMLNRSIAAAALRAVGLAAGLGFCPVAAAAPAGVVNRAPTAHQISVQHAHMQALDSFRRARFSEAYGRFIRLAEAGHPASARYALWMCQNGPALFGVLWDCSPDDVEDWTLAVRQPDWPAHPSPRSR